MSVEPSCHVTSLYKSERRLCAPQVIKILGTEKGKKNKTNLIFIAGNRVLKYAERSYSIEKSLTGLLK